MDMNTLRVLVKMMMSGDANDREVALRAMSKASSEDILNHLSDPDLPIEAMEFFAGNEEDREEWIAALRRNPSLPSSLRARLEPSQATAREGDTGLDPDVNRGEEDAKTEVEDKELSLDQKIQRMTVGEKIKAALKGGKETRSILLKNPNRQIFMSVLENPGLKEHEIEMLTRNTSTNVEILRAIAKNREWTSKKNILKGLVMNSKTPLQISMRFLPRMSLKELESIDRSRNLPSALRLNAKRLFLQKKKGR